MPHHQSTATARERAAANRLAEALIELGLAFEDGGEQRRAERDALLKQRVEAEVQLRSSAASGKVEPPAILPGLFDSRKAAKYLGVSTGTLFNHTYPRGSLRCVRIGTLVRYTKADLDAAIERFMAGPERQSGTIPRTGSK